MSTDAITLLRKALQDANDLVCMRHATRIAIEAFLAAPVSPPAGDIAWEGAPGVIKYVTDERYRKFSPAIQTHYKPYRCSACADHAAAPVAEPPFDWTVPAHKRIRNINKGLGEMRMELRRIAADLEPDHQPPTPGMQS